MDRRSFLRAGLSGAAALSTLCGRGRGAQAAPSPPPLLWVHLQATGGWDQALFCDPKPALRPGLPAAEREVRQAGNIPYLAFADFGQPAGSGFFGRFAARTLVVNGVDTGTNNHEVGMRYCATGSRNEGHPCLAAQVAAVYGQAQPLAFLDYGGYDQTASLIAPTRLQLGQSRLLRDLAAPNDSGLHPYLPPGSLPLIEEAQRRRTARLRQALRLPGAAQALASLERARAAQRELAKLTIPGGADTMHKFIDIALAGFQQQLTASVGLEVGGFDSHTDNEATQRARLAALLDLAGYAVSAADAQGVPMVLVMTSDFGRTAYYTGSGTDHWPVGSVVLVQSQAALQQRLALPSNQVLGATTDGAPTQALRARKVHPRTLRLDDAGVTLTPGHLVRALRRLAGIDGAEVLRPFPLSVDQDLAIG